MTTELYYKLLSEDGTTPEGHGKWAIPTDGPGDWMPPITGRLVLCKNAYHVLTLDQLIIWNQWAPVLIEVEIGKESLTDGEKTGVREARPLARVERWNDAVLRLFAADCAERVLPIFEKQFPHDDRPRKAIQAARDFARGIIDSNALGAAAGAAARDAWDAGDAAWAAAGAAARDAWDAGAAAWDARAAAGAAAGAAAWDAARDAAWDATWDARDAAWDAECAWQLNRLREYLEGTAI